MNADRPRNTRPHRARHVEAVNMKRSPLWRSSKKKRFTPRSPPPGNANRMARSIEIQGEPLAVDIYDPVRRRGDAVLIHGYTGSKEDFAEVGPLLALRGYRVIAFDNRGQNESAHSEREDAYSIASLACDATELADRFAMERPHLLGHSFGGLVAQRAV